MVRSLLTESQLEDFKENGYLLLKGVLDVNTCREFDANTVQPALQKYAGIIETDPHTFNRQLLQGMATGDFNEETPHYLPGVMVRKQPSGENPISDEESHKLNLSVLHPILDQLHRTRHLHLHAHARREPRNWEWLHENVGWIHVRFPYRHENHKDTRTWHVDGGHFSPHFLWSKEQSVVILPMIRPVGNGGGNTVVLKKSHIYMAQRLRDAGGEGIPKEVTQNANKIAKMWPKDLMVEISPCCAGDVLLMHPFLVHAAGLAHEGEPLRIAFNMGVRWTKDPVIRNEYGKGEGEQEESFLEECIAWSLRQELDFIDIISKPEL